MTSSTGLRHVDHDSVDFARNWTRTRVALARGDGGESGERRLGPNGRRGMAGGELWRRPVAVDGAGTIESERERARRRGGAQAHQERGELDGEPWGGRTATYRWLHGGGRRGRNEDGGGECGHPFPIPSAGRE